MSLEPIIKERENDLRRLLEKMAPDRNKIKELNQSYKEQIHW